MKANQKVIRSAGVAALVLALTVTAVTSTGDNVPSEERTVTALEKNGIAGVAIPVSGYELEAVAEHEQNVSVEREAVQVVAASIGEEAVSAAVGSAAAEEAALQGGESGEEAVLQGGETGDPEEDFVLTELSSAGISAVQQKAMAEELTPEEKEWQDKLMADVDDFLYVRAEADADSEIIGKMYKGHRALIREKGEEWTEIESGSVQGYVKNDYCVYGMEAYDYAKENCDTIVRVETDGLRVRSEADPDARVIKAVGMGEELVVDTDADEVSDWIAVKVDSETCYVSSDYVTLKLDTGKAITIEEEQAAIEAEEAARAAEEAARAAQAAAAANTPASSSPSGQTSSAGTSQGTSLAASADEETLLAALVECEAGGCGVQCMTAVAAVVINRVHSGSFPNSIYGVIYQSGQFGPASSGRLEQKLANGVSSGARQAARAALSGSDPTGGAKYFKLASSGHAGVVIGPIVFY